ncbi:TVP38/TMEM64 family protein [Candidatus Woesearchaeota archaeon]|nr:hypothetical protein [uncultured archaeon]MBS3123784.1 TVP38/TMEM64 family protein [Candidatus Woesearchaeota archaeon]
MKIAPKITWLLVTFLILILFTPLLFLPQLKVYASPSFIRDLTLGWGLWSYLIYVLIFILSVPLPLPSGPLALAGGYLFGIFWGSLLALLGLFVGSSISFIVARKFGQPLVEKLIDKHHIIHFNHLLKKRGLSFVLLAYSIPVFPEDSLDYLMGVSKVSYKTFVITLITGNIPRYLLINTLGSNLYSGFSWFTGLILLVIVIMVIVSFFREKIKRVLFKELKEVESEVKKLERGMGSNNFKNNTNNHNLKRKK